MKSKIFRYCVFFIPVLLVLQALVYTFNYYKYKYDRQLDGISISIRYEEDKLMYAIPIVGLVKGSWDAFSFTFARKRAIITCGRWQYTVESEDLDSAEFDAARAEQAGNRHILRGNDGKTLLEIPKCGTGLLDYRS